MGQWPTCTMANFVSVMQSETESTFVYISGQTYLIVLKQVCL